MANAPELASTSATDLLRLIQARAISPVEIVEDLLSRIERLNPALNAVVTIASDVMEQARKAEQQLISGAEVGPLHGLPLTVKDTIDTIGLRSTSGTSLRSDYQPKRDAPVVATLKAAGAIVLGKTNTPEMAIPYETANPVFGRTNNPYDLARTCGGSSGGEAAAIATCLSPAGIGSDLSGSIRVPAHFCGIVGLKPGTGRVPMDGHTPPAIGPLALGAAIGPMARSVADAARLFCVLAGETESTIRPDKLRGVRTGIYFGDRLAPLTSETREAMEAAASALDEAHLEVLDADPPALPEGPRLWIELFSRTAADQLREYYRGKEEEAGPLVAPILKATREDVSGTDSRMSHGEALARALIEREGFREELLDWMKTTPLLIMPVGSAPAFSHGARRLSVAGESVSVFRAYSLSQAVNVFGLPSVCVRAGESADGLPIGIQIIGMPNQEQTILAVAGIIEESLGGWRPAPQF